MKKAFILILSLFVCFACISCESSGEYLSSRDMKDFPFMSEEKLVSEDEDNARSEFSCSEEEYDEYALTVYEYLKQKDFKYFGTQGEYVSSLFGANPDYAFVSGEEIGDFEVFSERYDRMYIFVCSNEIDQSTGRLNLSSSAGLAVYVSYSYKTKTALVDFKTNFVDYVIRSSVGDK